MPIDDALETPLERTLDDASNGTPPFEAAGGHARTAQRTGRIVGAMVFLAFGCAWLEYYAVEAWAGAWPLIVAIAGVSGALLLAALRRYRTLRAMQSATALPSAGERRARRIFNIANAGQWAAIIVVGNLLVRSKLSAWLLPAVIAIVGLHLLPIAWGFRYRPHLVTGAALIALAIVYPLLEPAGPASPIGALGAGLILWASALWSLRERYVAAYAGRGDVAKDTGRR